MVWFLVALIIASIVYMVSIVGAYNAAVIEAREVILGLEKEALLLEKTISREREAIAQERRTLEDLRQTASDMQQELTLTNTKLKTAQKEETDLEMNMYKQEFKKSKQRRY